MVTRALVTPVLLVWARKRSGLSASDIANKMNIGLEKITDWEQGQSKPTFKQAQKFARCTHIPFGYLFLSTPPTEESLPIPDFRSLQNRNISGVSAELRDVIVQVLHKQRWYKDYLITHELPPNPFVGSLNLNDSIETSVKKIREAIQTGLPTQGNWEQYQQTLINAIENAGILIMRSGIVGNNTKRKLDASEFRGFAISDNYAPVIFINSADAPTARLFTLIHELTHIGLNISGVSDLQPSENTVEIYCNQVAGEFLIPKEPIVNIWNHKIAHKKNKGAGNFYTTSITRNSKKMSQAVVAEAKSGRLLLRDAGRILGVAPSHLKKYAENLL